ncbi:cytidylyltransferase domain-containing protein [Virgibacillus doumboii]|uniref:acylneuraminate cytidylyltransferase family protein n=1 Tax=Virgibacillus doumboii TaxID=2697503 RepID=UPI0013DF56B5|nr:acylneuraminate cytidylyltransferase family protein [Virgibacillus doumboii]
MINNKTVLAIIPARGGSKGVPRKNIKNLAGKPLIAWTIEEAKKSKYIDRLILTSEDKEIINVARLFGCEAPFIRPQELANDNTPGIEPILHAIEQVRGYDYVVLLQPTSPLRNTQDIDQTIEKCDKNNGVAAVSVTESDKSPYWMYQLEKEMMTPLIDINNVPKRRQDAPKAYVLNGAVYVSKVDKILEEKNFLQKEKIAHIMPSERSLDIDRELDFTVCEVMINNISSNYEN